MSNTLRQITNRVIAAKRVWLFLDYDGTLAEFAPTPDRVLPDPDVIDLMTQLSRLESVRVAVISGRPLVQIQHLVPGFMLVLAGTYGIELQMPDGTIIHRARYSAVRPTLEQLKARWQALVARQQGFFVEDKGWSLALHARFAEEAAADQILAAARSAAIESITSDRFRLLNGHRFFEVAPSLAHKGRTVEHLLYQLAWPDALPVYIGDDDKDEEAFAAIKARHGLALVVAAQPRPTLADCRLDSPASVRRWLSEIVTAFNHGDSIASMDKFQ